MKAIKYVIIAVIGVGLIWYLFFKSYDYLVTFEVKTSPGTLMRGIEDWDITMQNQDSVQSKIDQKVPFSSIKQIIKHSNGVELDINWEFISLNDSITRAKALILEKENSIYNKITAPFFPTLFKKTAIKTVKDYKKGMDFQLKNKFKVNVVGIDTVPELTYAYIKLTNVAMADKAQEMIINNADFLTFLNEHHLKKGEFPFLIIDRWDINSERIDFRYCFQIIEKDSLPFNNYIKYDSIKSVPALKAVYNGNYSTSDRGWYGLFNYAQRRGISIRNQPIEFFYSNPFYGEEELGWITEIFMPTIEQ